MRVQQRTKPAQKSAPSAATLNVLTENVITLATARKMWPAEFQPSVVTVWRYCTQGKRVGKAKVMLEHAKLCGRICTSEQAVTRFLQATQG